MTREQVELICKNVRELGQLVWEADRLDINDAEQRNIIDEQVEKNRGLRADVKLMQQVNAEQREEIRLLREELSKRTNLEGPAPCWNAAHMKEITRLRDALRSLKAMVKGECPSLLDDDSGGCGKLDIEIDELLQPKALTQEPT